VSTARNLCLHYVSRGPSTRAMTICEDDLRALIAREQEHRRAASLADYLAAPPPPDRFTISFDDAHASMIDALAILSDVDVTATLFVPTAYVGTSDDFLTWDQLRAIRDAGWTIGSHSETHPRMGWRLYDEDEAAHAKRLREELERSRDAIFRELGAAPRLFAYPYGEAPPVAREAVGAAGFEAAFTVSGDSAWDGDRLAIPRIDALERPIAEEDPTRFSVIVPAFDRARILSDVVTRLASLSYPKERYEVVVVDDGSREDLSPIFSEMPPNVRLVRQGDERFRAGQARQRGADEARFDHLVFLDADVAVAPDHLWHLDWAHRHTPGAVVLGYLSGYNLHDLGHLHAPEDVIGKRTSTLPVIPDRSREPVLRSCLDQLDWLEAPWGLTYTGNLSLPKALLGAIGGFGSEFVGWGLEDIDLGVRLHRAGARFVFSRFAIGWHIVDPNEETSRNPFRLERPSKEAFAGYLANLERLSARHAGDAEVQAYVERSRADIEETCARPKTVGIEMGGAASVRTPHHRRVHRMQPGGVPAHELFDRVAYAKKVGAETIYLLGGEPAEHPAFFELLRASREVVSWISMQSLVYPFAQRGFADRARGAGLRGVVALVHAFDRATYEDLHGPGTYDTFLRGLDALRDAGIELSAHLVVTRETARVLEATQRELERRAMKIVETTNLALR
jgi:peptidoglycan/xylan/chitin deacetylase (PgdA/CDA1 family)